MTTATLAPHEALSPAVVEPTLVSAMTETLSEMVDALVSVDATINALMGVRTELLNGMRAWSELTESAAPHSTPTSRELAARSLRAEVACALKVPERTAENLLGEAHVLCSSLPTTLAALKAGQLSYRHAHVITDHSVGLDRGATTRFERLAVPVAETSTVSTFDRAARKLRESLDPSSLENRTAAAVEGREAVWVPARDGMADLILHLPAPDVLAIYHRATDTARTLNTPDESRTLTQLRVDVMRDALLTETLPTTSTSRSGSAHSGRGNKGEEPGGGTHRGEHNSPGPVRADVHITVPVLSLLGHSHEPATLEGYGPIAVSTARKLAAHAPTFVRLLTHPETGAVLSVGRHRYTVPADLRHALRARDGTCAFPGCAINARYCDLDHTVDWAKGGTTSLNNLAYLCRSHHTLKHHTRWHVQQHPDGQGELTWTSPAGRNYLNEPAR